MTYEKKVIVKKYKNLVFNVKKVLSISCTDKRQ